MPTAREVLNLLLDQIFPLGPLGGWVAPGARTGVAEDRGTRRPLFIGNGITGDLAVGRYIPYMAPEGTLRLLADRTGRDELRALAAEGWGAGRRGSVFIDAHELGRSPVIEHELLHQIFEEAGVPEEARQEILRAAHPEILRRLQRTDEYAKRRENWPTEVVAYSPEYMDLEPVGIAFQHVRGTPTWADAMRLAERGYRRAAALREGTSGTTASVRPPTPATPPTPVSNRKQRR
jgi:hypothetical protein